MQNPLSIWPTGPAREEKTMQTISLDFETRSLADISLGSYLYARHPSTRAMCVAALVDGQSFTARFDPNGLSGVQPMPPWLAERIGTATVWAWNVSFEQNIWRHVLRWPEPTAWRCRMAVAAANGLPQGLDKAATFLGIEAKHKDGQKVMKRVCVPKNGALAEPSEDDWRLLVDYCAQDVAIEAKIGDILGDLIPSEVEAWKACNAINHRGMGVDRQLCEAALAINAQLVAEAGSSAVAASGGAIQADELSNVAKVLAWVQSQGVDMEELTASSIAGALRRKNLPEHVRTVLLARKASARISITKFRALLDRTTDEDPRLRDQLKYHGAQETGRWKSAGESMNSNRPASGVQVQNFPRPAVKSVPEAIAAVLSHDVAALVAMTGGEPEKALTSCIRPAIVPKPGHVFIVSDYSGIEARGCPWLCDDQKHLNWWLDYDQGRGPDGYCRLATGMFGREITKADKQERNGGKEAWLSGQYQVGPDKYGERASTVYGVDFAKIGKTPQQMIAAFRSEFYLVKDMWDRLQRCVTHVIETRSAARCGKLRFAWDERFSALAMTLPSGRVLRAHKTKIEMVEKDFGYGLKTVPQITYQDYSDGNPATCYLYGGKVLQRATQASMRDLLAYTLVRCEAEGLPVVLHAHDEVVVEAPESEAEEALARVEAIMQSAPEWAAGLPIATEAMITTRYAKEAIGSTVDLNLA